MPPKANVQMEKGGVSSYNHARKHRPSSRCNAHHQMVPQTWGLLEYRGGG
jgi:hypothetical protein